MDVFIVKSKRTKGKAQGGNRHKRRENRGEIRSERHVSFRRFVLGKEVKLIGLAGRSCPVGRSTHQAGDPLAHSVS